jgi:hypothetical protein
MHGYYSRISAYIGYKSPHTIICGYLVTTFCFKTAVVNRYQFSDKEIGQSRYTVTTMHIHLNVSHSLAYFILNTGF